jgi:hypothetical protein
MKITIAFCWRKASECERLAHVAQNENTRDFFLKSRDSWIAVANRLNALDAEYVREVRHDEVWDDLLRSPERAARAS